MVTEVQRKPSWLKVPAPGGGNYLKIKENLRSRNLHTVCEEARCPNMGECWNGGTATFMLLGDVCTRGCRFCAVKSGNPGGLVDEGEPEHVAQAVSQLGLTYVVLTVVDRDDLPDGGAAHIAETIRKLKQYQPDLLVEILMGDFQGNREHLKTVADSGADVLAHNIETVERLTRTIRDRRSGYRQTLEALRFLKESAPGRYTKSSIMLGLGEEDAEVERTMRDLREYGVDVLTLGQYLRPTPKHAEVKRFVTPQEFDRWRVDGEEMGFLYVASGPLVRSSYKAGEYFLENRIRREKWEMER